MSVEIVKGASVPSENQRALRHGAQSGALLSTVAAELCDALIGTYPWFLETDSVGIEQYCRAEAKARLLDDHITKVVEKRGVGRVAPYLWGASNNADTAAMRAAEAIGLTPMGRMKIAKDAGFVAHFSADRVGSLTSQGAALRHAAGR